VHQVDASIDISLSIDVTLAEDPCSTYSFMVLVVDVVIVFTT